MWGGGVAVVVFTAAAEVRDFETRTRTCRDKTPAVTLAPKSCAQKGSGGGRGWRRWYTAATNRGTKETEKKVENVLRTHRPYT